VIGVGFGMVASRFEIVVRAAGVAPYSIYLSLGVSLLTGCSSPVPGRPGRGPAPIEALRYE